MTEEDLKKIQKLILSQEISNIGIAAEVIKMATPGEIYLIFYNIFFELYAGDNYDSKFQLGINPKFFLDKGLEIWAMSALLEHKNNKYQRYSPKDIYIEIIETKDKKISIAVKTKTMRLPDVVLYSKDNVNTKFKRKIINALKSIE